MTLRTITFLQSPMKWALWQYHTSFIGLLRSQTFTYPVSKALLTSKSMRLVNPRSHAVKTDQVSMLVSASSIRGLSDEEVLARLAKGFFGGFIFLPERTAMRWGIHKWLPVKFAGLESSPDEKVLWKASEIPKSSLLQVGDVISGAFKMTDYHLQGPSEFSTSYVDFCFGSDESRFGGCHRFAIIREASGESNADGETEGNKEEQFKVLLEHFRCNPQINADSWAEYIPWVHYWYAMLLFADAVRTLLSK
ncbi:hypothetical protein HYFRA_00003589 [Hymenoscyphus fraxineus]|uniref:Uncharacterized protein n=1 Tax=Hymenoscyphus fraxineus TaxID=746836 RepID=A0A9N9PJT7_9HELO|nr:hypothetical protein HYFRA_00003589 [Hymenoscyphus fraxineus]